MAIVMVMAVLLVMAMVMVPYRCWSEMLGSMSLNVK